MDLKPVAEVEAAAKLFELPGPMLDAVPYGSGHINRTFLARFEGPKGAQKRILQEINTNVFREPEGMMDNILRVTRHLERACGREGGTTRTFRVFSALDGRPFAYDEAGRFWRMISYIEGTRSFDKVESPEMARSAGRAFGKFQAQLIDLPGPRLFDSIPRFHDGGLRFEALASAIANDLEGRLQECRTEITFVLEREAVLRKPLEMRASGELPERITHNDTKINNLLFDEESGEPVCVVDLDTVMPGLAGYDFGDLVRTATSPSDEDERDLDKVEVQPDLYAALLDGYLESAESFLTPRERETLLLFGKMITLMIGVRYLTDHLSGDRYFRIHREGHNLDRARVQLKIVASLERQESELQGLTCR